MPSKPGKLVTEVTHVFKTKEVSWGVINTEMNVEELQRVYNCTNMVGISPQSGHKGIQLSVCLNTWLKRKLSKDLQGMPTPAFGYAARRTEKRHSERIE